MSLEFHHYGTNNTEKKKRGLLLSTRLSWTKLIEDFPAPKAAVECIPSNPQLGDREEENFYSWTNSGFYLSASKELQERRQKAEALSRPLSMIQMTVQNYMRSKHHFSETPILSRWNNASSSRFLLNTPKSVTEWLDLSEKDPVEILIDLGFGTDEPDICTKIPLRFISCASMAKGINIRVFIEAQRQRMDTEAPNLYGRFRQLEILDCVTSAFSSLLSNVSTVQQKWEEGNIEEKIRINMPKGKSVATQVKKRRIGQLLRKVSRETATTGLQAYQNAGICKSQEHFAAPNLHFVTWTGFSDNAALVSLKEEPTPSKEEEEAMIISPSPQIRAAKTCVLSHLPLKEPYLFSTSEIPIKERPRMEPNLLLTHTLRRLSGLSCKPSDSFEMEEIQSFEDETLWGNSLENTAGTRTNSCQSDSSGFLEDPLEPLPLQVGWDSEVETNETFYPVSRDISLLGLPLPINMRFSCNSHDNQEFAQHRKYLLFMTQDHESHIEGASANLSIADDNTVSLLPSLSEENTLQEEERFYSITEEDISYETCSCRSENSVNKTVNTTDENEMQSRSRQLGKKDSLMQDCVSAPGGNCFSSFGKKHLSTGSTSIEKKCMTLMRLSGGQNFQDRKECDEPSSGGRGDDVCRKDIPEDIAECEEGKLYETKAYEKLDIPISETNVTSKCQGVNFKDAFMHLDIMASDMEHDSMVELPQINAISRSCSLWDSSLPLPYFENKEHGSLGLLPTSTELNKGGMKRNSFKSVTVQMPSKLVSNMQSISLGEAAIRDPSMVFSPKMSHFMTDESVASSVLLESTEKDKQMREASVQTNKKQRMRETLPLSHCLPSFQGHGHLVKSASLDTGLYRENRTYFREPLNAWCAQPRAHCCSLNSHHSCFRYPLSPSCKHPTICCSFHSNTELQLLKTLKLLQDTAIRNISSYTANEIEVMKNSCRKFQERLDEIERHLKGQEALFPNTLSNEGREERQQLKTLRQTIRQEVAELECQLQDWACPAKEGILTQLKQLLSEQSTLCSELGVSDSQKEREAKTGHSLPDAADTTFSARVGCLKEIQRRIPRRSATAPSSVLASLPQQTDPHASALATGKISLASDPKEPPKNKKEIKDPSQPKMDFKAFIQNLKRSLRSSFSHDGAEERE